MSLMMRVNGPRTYVIETVLGGVVIFLTHSLVTHALFNTMYYKVIQHVLAVNLFYDMSNKTIFENKNTIKR